MQAYWHLLRSRTADICAIGEIAFYQLTGRNVDETRVGCAGGVVYNSDVGNQLAVLGTFMDGKQDVESIKTSDLTAETGRPPSLAHRID